jgi:branched-chain amino acid transport system substrate-binding protein
MTTMHRRQLMMTTLGAIALATFATPASFTPAQAQDKAVTIGIELPLTGADADSATRIKNGIVMGINDVNAAGGVAGYKLNVTVLDSGTSTAGQYDPAQAATNAKKLVADPNVVAIVGPEMSGEGKAMTPILSAANLAAITPSSTNPDITDPKFAGQYKPGGKAIYFRTVTTDAYQGPNMANYMRDTLKVKSVYILDDSGAYGVGMSNAYEVQAKKIGMNVMGHDQLDPKEADYTTIITKIKQLNPDAIYYGGVAQAGVKVAKQIYDIFPTVIKCGGDGMVDGGILSGVGFPAIEGWYVTQASPHVMDDATMTDWVGRYTKAFNMTPSDYAITGYDAVLVIADSIKRVVAGGQPVNRDTVRDAMQSTKLNTLQGPVAFDENGDILNKVISVFEIHHDAASAEDDVQHQYKYIGVAPEAPAS